jgi:hypothetical protein
MLFILITLLLLLKNCVAEEGFSVPHYAIHPIDVERWLAEGLRRSPGVTLEALTELERWKSSATFKKWQTNTINPFEIYLPLNVTSDTCYIVRLKEDTPKILIDFLQDTVLERWKGEIRHYYEKLMRGLLLCFKEASADAIGTLKELPWIDYIERDCIISCGQVQKRAPWGLSRIAQPKLPLSMQFGFDVTGKGIDVYVLDSGIFSEHPGTILVKVFSVYRFLFNFPRIWRSSDFAIQRHRSS